MSGETEPLSLCAAGISRESCISRRCEAVAALPWTAVSSPGCTSGFPAWGCLGEQGWLTALTRSFQVELGRKPSYAACWQSVALHYPSAAALPIRVRRCCCSRAEGFGYTLSPRPLLHIPWTELLFHLAVTTELWFLPRTEGNPGVYII